MQNTPPVLKRPVPEWMAFFGSAGLGLPLACVLAVLADYVGLVFSGLDSIGTVVATTFVCALLTLATAIRFKRKGRHFGWRTLFVEVTVLTLVGVVLLSWIGTRLRLRIFMNPEPVPRELKVLHSRSDLFTSYVHFTAPPAVIAKLIQLKELVETPDDPEQALAFPGYYVMQRTKESRDWWQPVTMSNPRFYFRPHQSQAPQAQGWYEAWWVNGATNEVYAIVGG